MCIFNCHHYMYNNLDLIVFFCGGMYIYTNLVTENFKLLILKVKKNLLVIYMQ